MSSPCKYLMYLNSHHKKNELFVALTKHPMGGSKRAVVVRPEAAVVISINVCLHEGIITSQAGRAISVSPSLQRLVPRYKIK